VPDLASSYAAKEAFSSVGIGLAQGCVAQIQIDMQLGRALVRMGVRQRL